MFRNIHFGGASSGIRSIIFSKMKKALLVGGAVVGVIVGGRRLGRKSGGYDQALTTSRLDTAEAENVEGGALLASFEWFLSQSQLEVD